MESGPSSTRCFEILHGRDPAARSARRRAVSAITRRSAELTGPTTIDKFRRRAPDTGHVAAVPEPGEAGGEPGQPRGQGGPGQVVEGMVIAAQWGR